MYKAVKLLSVLSALILSVTSCFAQAQSSATPPKYKVLLVLVYSAHCKEACQIVRPIVNELALQYGDQVKLIEMDVSSDKLKEAEKTAKEWHVMDYLAGGFSEVPVVGVFDAKGRFRQDVSKLKDKKVYEAVIRKVLNSK